MDNYKIAKRHKELGGVSQSLMYVCPDGSMCNDVVTIQWLKEQV